MSDKVTMIEAFENLGDAKRSFTSVVKKEIAEFIDAHFELVIIAMLIVSGVLISLAAAAVIIAPIWLIDILSA